MINIFNENATLNAKQFPQAKPNHFNWQPGRPTLPPKEIKHASTRKRFQLSIGKQGKKGKAIRTYGGNDGRTGILKWEREN